MGGKDWKPVFAENFSTNLESIRIFLTSDGQQAYARLLNRLFGDVVPSLRRFPKAGRAFLAHPIRSLEGAALLKKLKSLLKREEEIREFIVDDYLILYLVRKKEIVFLSIKHHRQLSFDLKKIWPA